MAAESSISIKQENKSAIGIKKNISDKQHPKLLKEKLTGPSSSSDAKIRINTPIKQEEIVTDSGGTSSKLDVKVEEYKFDDLFTDFYPPGVVFMNKATKLWTPKLQAYVKEVESLRNKAKKTINIEDYKEFNKHNQRYMRESKFLRAWLRQNGHSKLVKQIPIFPNLRKPTTPYCKQPIVNRVLYNGIRPIVNRELVNVRCHVFNNGKTYNVEEVSKTSISKIQEIKPTMHYINNKFIDLTTVDDVQNEEKPKIEETQTTTHYNNVIDLTDNGASLLKLNMSQRPKLKTAPTDSNVAHTLIRIKNKFGVDLTDADSPDTEIDMFAEGDKEETPQHHNKDVKWDVILEKLEAAIYRKADFKPFNSTNTDYKSIKWSNWIKSMYKVSKELYDVAISTKAIPDIRKFNKTNNEYLTKLKRLKQDLMANKLSLDLLKDIPTFSNMKSQRTSQYKEDKNPEKSKAPLLKDPVNKPKVYQAPPTIYEPLPSPITYDLTIDTPATHTQRGQAKAKASFTGATITRTITSVPVVEKTTNTTVTKAQTTSTANNATINRSLGMPHSQPLPTQQGTMNLGLSLPMPQPSYPKGIPRSFLNPHHPMAVNYKNHQVPADLTANELHQLAQNEQYNPEESFMDDHNDSQDGAADCNDPSESTSGQKRVRAFDRLGPMTQPKKPKLTINLLFSKEQAAVREVIDDDDDAIEPEKSPPPQHVPVTEREEVVNSRNPIVIKFRYQWPWDMTFSLEKTAMPRNSKSVMIMEAEQMLELYDRSNKYVQVKIIGYPPHFTKEDVLDILLENATDKRCVPIFIDFKPTECNFLLIRSRPVLQQFHRRNLVITQDKLELPLKISTTDLGLESVALVPKQILKTMLNDKMIEGISLDLQEFCLQPDITHFMYYPLKRLQNQVELMELNTRQVWSNLKEINLSHNKLTTIEGFNLAKYTPHLQYLDLSFNYLQKMVDLLCVRGVGLRALKLEGNPLCGEYIDPDHYVKVARMIFPRLREFDGIPIPRLGETPDVKQNYCPPSAKHVAEKFIETFIPLLDLKPEERTAMEELYSENAVLTITFRYRLRYTSTFKYFRDLFSRSRCLEEIDMDSVNGAKHIVKLFTKWPELKHDPFMTTVDVMSHDENTTILRIGGVIRLSSSSLSEDEHMLSFARTVVLHTKNGHTYKIYNEMIQWDELSEELARSAFQITAVKPKELTLSMETEPDDFMKERLAKIFMEITGLNEHQTERCLELKSWNFKDAMEYFIKLVKLGSTDILDLSGN